MSGYSVNKNTVDGSVDPRTKNHWKRHRKVEVDLLHGAPFVLDRQLEDQKYQLEFNRVLPHSASYTTSIAMFFVSNHTYLLFIFL